MKMSHEFIIHDVRFSVNHKVNRDRDLPPTKRITILKFQVIAT